MEVLKELLIHLLMEQRRPPLVWWWRGIFETRKNPMEANIDTLTKRNGGGLLPNRSAACSPTIKPRPVPSDEYHFGPGGNPNRDEARALEEINQALREADELDTEANTPF